MSHIQCHTLGPAVQFEYDTEYDCGEVHYQSNGGGLRTTCGRRVYIVSQNEETGAEDHCFEQNM